MPLLPDITLQKVHKNPFTETVKGGGVDGLYSKNHKYTIPEMFSSHDIKRAQTYYMMENKLSKDHWDNLMSRYGQVVRGRRTSSHQTKIHTPHRRSMYRTQEVQPQDLVVIDKLYHDDEETTVLGEKVTAKLNPENVSRIDEQTLSLPLITPTHLTTTMNAGDILSETGKCWPKVLGRFNKEMNVVYNLNKRRSRSMSPSTQLDPGSFEAEWCQKRAEAGSSEGRHSMLRRPMLMPPMVSSSEMTRIQKDGQNFISGCGPPVDLGLDRAGWMSEEQLALVNLKQQFPIHMQYFKRDFIVRKLQENSVEIRRTDSHDSQMKQDGMFKKTVFRTHKLKEILKKKLTRSPPSAMIKKHGLVDAIRGVAEERLECFETEPIKNSLTRQNERWRDNLQKYAAHDVSNYIEAFDKSIAEEKEAADAASGEDSVHLDTENNPTITIDFV